MNTNFTMKGASGLLLGLPPALIQYVVIGIAVFQLVLMFVLAFAVKTDAEKKQLSPDGLFLVSPLVWFFVVLLTGGYVGAFGYWVIHYSAQRYRRDERA